MIGKIPHSASLSAALRAKPVQSTVLVSWQHWAVNVPTHAQAPHAQPPHGTEVVPNNSA